MEKNACNRPLEHSNGHGYWLAATRDFTDFRMKKRNPFNPPIQLHFSGRTAMCCGAAKAYINGAKTTQKCASMMHIGAGLHGIKNACNYLNVALTSGIDWKDEHGKNANRLAAEN
jgi:hypothetical protein